MVKHRAASVGCAIAHKKRALPGVEEHKPHVPTDSISLPWGKGKQQINDTN